MENLRVRRAGFAYRRSFENFLNRYKSLCPKTWPFYNKDDVKKSIIGLCHHIGMTENDFTLGKYDFNLNLINSIFKQFI